MKPIRLGLIILALLLASCSAMTIETSLDSDRANTPAAHPAETVTVPMTIEEEPANSQQTNPASDATVSPTRESGLRETRDDGAGPAHANAAQQDEGATAAATPTAITVDADAIEQLLINVYERVSPAVVHVQITGEESSFGQRSGAGSGFVLDKAGHIVTNNHVIEDAEEIEVSFADGTQGEAQVIGTDPAVDLAVLQVNVSEDVLVPVELGNSDTLRIGQRAIAIGNPFGQFQQSMTVGIISALGRVLEPIRNEEFIPELIQTDAAINPGNSGGPLLDSQGRVIGINTLIFSQTGTSVGVGFAVPVNTLRRSLPALLEGRKVGQPWLGIAGPPELDATLVEELGLPADEGAYVNFVFAGSPAEEAGILGGSEKASGTLQPGGDFITAIDGVEVASFNELLSYISRETRVGQTVHLTVVRGDDTEIVPVTLGERPDG